jgi:23S rRNA-/tRNA-specific pseudouridylate synthase
MSKTARNHIISNPLDFISILHEDDSLLVISKPRAMHSITLRDTDPLTVADCIACYYPFALKATPDPREAGLIHRLDFYTSGVMIAAKTRAVWDYLRDQLMCGQISKSYLALVEGQVEHQNFLICKEIYTPKNSKKVKVLNDYSTGDVTEVDLIKSFPEHNLSLVKASAPRAKRHQIRAHLASKGHPLLGDELYGSTLKLSSFPTTSSLTEGFYLHADSVSFTPPKTSKKLNIASKDMFS